MADNGQLFIYEVSSALSRVGAGFAIIGQTNDSIARYFTFAFMVGAQKHIIMVLLRHHGNVYQFRANYAGKIAGAIVYLIDFRANQNIAELSGRVMLIVHEATHKKADVRSRDNFASLRLLLTEMIERHRAHGPTVYDPRKRGLFICIDADAGESRALIQNVRKKLSAKGQPPVCLDFPDQSTFIGSTLISYADGDIDLPDSMLDLLCRAHRIEKQETIREIADAGRNVVASEYMLHDYASYFTFENDGLHPDMIITTKEKFPVQHFAPTHVVILHSTSEGELDQALRGILK